MRAPRLPADLKVGRLLPRLRSQAAPARRAPKKLIIPRGIPPELMGGEEQAEEAANLERTLAAEGAIRVHYMRDRVRGMYYANRRVRRDAHRGVEVRPALRHASRESALKIMVYARYLFLEIWQSRLLEETAEATLERMGIRDCPQLEGIIGQDPDTRELVKRMRNRFSANPDLTLEEAMGEIGHEGFKRFWRCVQRIIVFQDAAGAASYRPWPLNGAAEAAGIGLFPADSMLWEEKLRLIKRYGKSPYSVNWGTGNSRQIMQECAACIRVLLDDYMAAATLHQCYHTAETLQRLVSSTYGLKYIILEVSKFAHMYRTLGIPNEPKFLAREKKYKMYRNWYAAHSDARVPSILHIARDREFAPELVRDAEEITVLSQRLFAGLGTGARIELPTGQEVEEMEREEADLRTQARAQLGGRLTGSGLGRRREELRAIVASMYG